MRKTLSSNLVIVLLTIGMFAFFSIAADRFFTFPNVENLLVGYSFLAIVAVGQGLVIMARGIDLSVGSTVALAAMVLFDAVMIFEFGGPVAIFLALLAATLAGALNGVLVVYLRLQPFVATLATLAAYRGVVFAISGRQLYPELSSQAVRDPVVRWLGDIIEVEGWFGDMIPLPWIPTSFFVLLIYAAIVALALWRTQWGMNLRTYGGNPEAAHLAGLNTKRLLISVYALCGFSAGLAGVILVGRFTTATEALGAGMELTAIAAAVIGGIGLSGGTGGVLGPIFGAFLLGIILIGLTLMGTSQFYQQILTGAILIAAVGYDRLVTKRGGSV
ncbi:MAG: ABC transporter permease [Litoreibacter sp.]|nr:ABC transporter permease [Litoreibacter sp.]